MATDKPCQVTRASPKVSMCAFCGSLIKNIILIIPSSKTSGSTVIRSIARLLITQTRCCKQPDLPGPRSYALYPDSQESVPTESKVVRHNPPSKASKTDLHRFGSFRTVQGTVIVPHCAQRGRQGRPVILSMGPPLCHVRWVPWGTVRVRRIPDPGAQPVGDHEILMMHLW